jgi:hypothetical protein
MIGASICHLQRLACIRFWAKAWGLLGHRHIYDILCRLISILTPSIYANYVSITSVWQPNFRHLAQVKSTRAAKYSRAKEY